MAEENEERKFEFWEEVIKDYIDGLGDEKKIDEYRDFIIVNFLRNELLNVEINESEERKEQEKKIKKVRSIKNTAANRKKIEKYYENFQQNGWIADKKSQLLFFDNKQCFYNIWVCRTLVFKNVYPATHISKMTHSSSGGFSIDDKSVDINNRYFSTSSLKSKTIDGAYPDAALSKNVKFLMLQHKGKLLSDELIAGNKETLRNIAENENELSEWIKQFQVLLRPQPKSDNFAKQVYFPVDDETYHLLTVLKSSPVIQAVYDKYFGALSRKHLDYLRKSISRKRFQTREFQRPVNVARIATTLSQPQNVSVLNGGRGGNIRLFSTQPPTWKSQLKPPIAKSSFFYGIYGRLSINENIDYLRDFLLRFERISLSIKDPSKKKWVDSWVINIIEDVIAYAATIRSLPSGWTKTENVKLKKEHQYFLDPYRDDEFFQSERRSSDWQSVICNDFAIWLNGRLKGKEKKFTPQREHTRMWKKIMGKELRDFVQIADAHIHDNIKEET